MKVTVIVARSRNGVIGKDNDLPWHLPADLKYFKQVTMGHHILMGRKTWESIGRALPGRTSIVITRDVHYKAEGAIVTHSLAEAIQKAIEGGDTEAFVIGGAEIITQAVEQGLADHLHITEIQADVEGDIFLDKPDQTIWKEISREHYKADEKNNMDFDFVEYAKI
jgi:dihydrofolate reductase